MSENSNDGDFHAFPTSSVDGFTQHGMMLRDYFAGQFLVGAVFSAAEVPLDLSNAADQYDVDCALREHWSHAARTAYIAADAMIKARSHSPTPPIDIEPKKGEVA